MGISVLNPFLLLGVWGLRPQRGRGAEPPWGFGGKAPNLSSKMLPTTPGERHQRAVIVEHVHAGAGLEDADFGEG